MRLGGPVFDDFSDPGGWIDALGRLEYSAAYCPVGDGASDEAVGGYAQAAEKAGIVIAEVGAWGNNPLSRDEATRKESIENVRKKLDLADRIGARCCVNVSGSRGDEWAGPHVDNLTAGTFDLVVETTRQIIDGVKPKRTSFCIETMQWTYPDSVDSYVELVKAVDRKAFGVHMDPVNLVCSPRIYFDNASLIKDFVRRLGPHIRSCHAKDITLSGKATVHLDECRPGTGGLNYRVYLSELRKLDGDMPLMIEHLPDAEEYAAAAKHIRETALEVEVAIR